MRLIILLIAASVLLIPSCTIQKRTFRKGYYVSWNNPRNFPEKTREPDVNYTDAIRPDDQTEEETPVISEHNILQEKVTSKVPDTDLAPVKTNERVSSETRVEQQFSRENERKPALLKKSTELKTGDKPHKKLNFFALGSFGLSLVYGGLILLSISMSLSESIAAVAILFLFAAIACAVIAFVKWGRNREKYWGTFFAVIALLIVFSATVSAFAYLIAISA